jgi:hypothetical protein
LQFGLRSLFHLFVPFSIMRAFAVPMPLAREGACLGIAESSLVGSTVWVATTSKGLRMLHDRREGRCRENCDTLHFEVSYCRPLLPCNISFPLRGSLTILQSLQLFYEQLNESPRSRIDVAHQRTDVVSRERYCAQVEAGYKRRSSQCRATSSPRASCRVCEPSLLDFV